MSQLLLPVPLSAAQKGTFAYRTVKDRLPVILTKVIDYLCRCRDGIIAAHGQEAREDLKQIIGSLSQLRSEIQTNKPLADLKSRKDDAGTWQEMLEAGRKGNSGVYWFNSPWLLVECFMYRKMREAFERSKVLQDFDPWFEQKQSALQAAVGTVEIIAQHLQKINDGIIEPERENLFRQFLELSLWSNRHDLSISAGELSREHHADPIGKLVELKANLIVDDFDSVWRRVSGESGGKIAIILDNCGCELASDLLLADFLIRSHLAVSIRFYVKSIPWFVSDVLKRDFFYTLDALSDVPDLSPLVTQWREYLNEGKWVVCESDFFTLPCDYSVLHSVNSALYEELSQCKLLVFKGDLNYRKLVGDLKWHFSEKFSRALRGFSPAPLVALRTLKAEVVVGLAEGVPERCLGESEDWLVTGDYGVIQYCDESA